MCSTSRRRFLAFTGGGAPNTETAAAGATRLPEWRRFLRPRFGVLKRFFERNGLRNSGVDEGVAVVAGRVGWCFGAAGGDGHAADEKGIADGIGISGACCLFLSWKDIRYIRTYWRYIATVSYLLPKLLLLERLQILIAPIVSVIVVSVAVTLSFLAKRRHLFTSRNH